MKNELELMQFDESARSFHNMNNLMCLNDYLRAQADIKVIRDFEATNKWKSNQPSQTNFGPSEDPKFEEIRK